MEGTSPVNAPCPRTETDGSPGPKSNIILYINGMDAARAYRLRKRIDPDPPDEALEWYSDSEPFIRRICRLPRDIGTAVLFIPDGERLSEMTGFIGLLEGVRRLLILPEENTFLRRRALNLSPSYVCSPDSDFSDLAAVLDKIRGRTARMAPHKAGEENRGTRMYDHPSTNGRKTT